MQFQLIMFKVGCGIPVRDVEVVASLNILIKSMVLSYSTESLEVVTT